MTSFRNIAQLGSKRHAAWLSVVSSASHTRSRNDRDCAWESLTMQVIVRSPNNELAVRFSDIRWRRDARSSQKLCWGIFVDVEIDVASPIELPKDLPANMSRLLADLKESRHFARLSKLGRIGGSKRYSSRMRSSSAAYSHFCNRSSRARAENDGV